MALADHKNLESLWLTGNEFGEQGFEAILDAIRTGKMPSLHTVGLAETFIMEGNNKQRMKQAWKQRKTHQYEGEKGAERLARVVWDDGGVMNLEGEGCGESRARDLPSGTVVRSRARGSERKVSRRG